MPNFGKYFLQGFNQTFNPTFQNVLNDLQIKRRQDEQRQFYLNQKNAELQQEQQQKNLAYDLASGREPDVLGQILGQPQVPFTDTTRMITPDRQGDILRQLDKTGLDYYKDYNEVLNPKAKQQKTVTVDGKVFLENPLYENVPVGDALYELPEKEKEPKPAWVADEFIGDKMRKLIGYKNPDADPKSKTTRMIDGEPYTITNYAMYDIYEKKSTDSGDEYWDLSDQTKKMLKDYYKRQQELRAITNARFGAREDPKTGKTYQESLGEFNKVYLQAVRNVMPEKAKKWYDKLYNAGGDNIDPRDYLLNLKNSFAKGELDVSEYNSLLEQFKPIYGYDPREIFGQSLEKIQ